MSRKKPEYKLYIFTRRNMSPEQQAVQAGHAVADFVKRHPKSGWSNGTLIYLSVRDEKSFDLWLDILDAYKVFNKTITGYYYDPDLHDDVPTAMFLYGEYVEELVRDLPLLEFRK